MPRRLAPAYVAGLLDGEGCFCIYARDDHRSKSNVPSYRCEIVVGMTDPRPLEALAEFFDSGTVSHMSRQKEGWARRYSWKTGDPAKIELGLITVMPHMIVKYNQAYVIGQFCQRRLSKPRTAAVSPEMAADLEEYKKNMNRFNTKGLDYVPA